MLSKQGHLRALSRICRRFGGQLEIIAQHKYDAIFSTQHLDESLHEAPFTDAHGLHWGKKIVYAVHGREEVGSIIHEMGHVFADAHHPEHVECCEWNWFGWEVALARWIRAGRTWSRHNYNYSTGDEGGGDWGTLSTRQRQAVIAERLAHARKSGVIDERGFPRSIR